MKRCVCSTYVGNRQIKEKTNLKSTRCMPSSFFSYLYVHMHMLHIHMCACTCRATSHVHVCMWCVSCAPFCGDPVQYGVLPVLSGCFLRVVLKQ